MNLQITSTHPVSSCKEDFKVLSHKKYCEKVMRTSRNCYDMNILDLVSLTFLRTSVVPSVTRSVRWRLRPRAELKRSPVQPLWFMVIIANNMRSSVYLTKALRSLRSLTMTLLFLGNCVFLSTTRIQGNLSDAEQQCKCKNMILWCFCGDV